MPRYAQPVHAPSARKCAPATASAVPRQPGPKRGAIWHALQLKAAQSAAPAPAPVTGTLPRSGLPAPLKAGIEHLSGIAMDDVRVHRNSAEPAKVGALAFAQGSDIHLGPGQDRHLPHEAWHVVQQKQGRVKPTMQMMDGLAVNDDAGLESEADRMGAKALASVGSAYAIPAEHEIEGSPGQPVKQAFRGDSAIQFNLTDAAKWAAGTAGWAAGTANWAFWGGLWKVGAYRPGVEEGDAAERDMVDDYHTEDDVADVAEEPIKRGDLVLRYIEPGHRTQLGQQVIQENPELYQQYRDMAARHNDNPTAADFLAWYNQGVVTKSWLKNWFVRQNKRGPGDSFQEGYATDNFGPFARVTYTRDTYGCINFASVKAGYTTWLNPVNAASEVQLNEGSSKSTHGVGARGLIPLAQASRAQHFGIANRMIGGAGNASPNKWTWHHLPTRYKMVLVDRQVHRKHGHNGGKLLW